VKDHKPGCPRLVFWDAGESEAPCICAELPAYAVRKMNPARLSSQDCDWHTPRDLFAQLNAEFRFEVDVCASVENHLCERYFDVNENGLLQRWAPRVCYMNPPYGGDILRWMQKALEESHLGATVVCLVPARVDTEWWHELVMKAEAEIRFIRGRLKFGSAKSSAPFPSAIVVYRPGVARA
jgi:phage N-6-adenine-methyltransferase